MEMLSFKLTLNREATEPSTLRPGWALPCSGQLPLATRDQPRLRNTSHSQNPSLPEEADIGLDGKREHDLESEVPGERLHAFGTLWKKLQVILIVDLRLLPLHPPPLSPPTERELQARIHLNRKIIYASLGCWI